MHVGITWEFKKFLKIQQQYILAPSSSNPDVIGIGDGNTPWRWKQLPTPVFLPEESHGQRSLAGYSPQGRKELETTKVTYHARTLGARIFEGSTNDPIVQQLGNHSAQVLKWITSDNLHLRPENLQLSEYVLLYSGVGCGSESHHWNRRELLAKNIHSFVIWTKIMSPLVGKKKHYCFLDYSDLLYIKHTLNTHIKNHIILQWNSRIIQSIFFPLGTQDLDTVGSMYLLLCQDVGEWYLPDSHSALHQWWNVPRASSHIDSPE